MEPNEIIVLGAIRRGAKKFGKIRSKTNIDPKEINTILERLEEKGMIIVQEKKGWLGKSVEIHATQKGQDELESRIAQMQDRWGEMIALQKAGDKGKMKGFMDDNRSFLPMMMFFGIMDMMMFSAMFSMIGASAGDYVPADQMPDAGAGDSGDAGFLLTSRHGVYLLWVNFVFERILPNFFAPRRIAPSTMISFGSMDYM